MPIVAKDAGMPCCTNILTVKTGTLNIQKNGRNAIPSAISARRIEVEELTKAMEILDKISFFGGQRAGRELWNDKTREVQDEDIASFNRDIEWLREFICKHMNDGCIPVEERLPDNSEDVLVTTDVGLITFGYVSHGKWITDQEPDYPIAWRPLPEPYRPERRTSDD